MATCPTCRTHYDDAVAVCEADGSKLLPDEAFTNADVDLKPGAQVGEYRVEAKLGAGGFGTVYRAQHPVIGKTAAIKVLAREFSSKPEMVARFIDEARAVNQIRHKGIIDIFAFGSLPDGRHYFVMELLEGMSLDAYIRQKGHVPVGEAIPIMRGIARAVDAAHLAGIAHRDLKPDNVFLVIDREGDAHTKLLDFGIAKLLSERRGRTQTGTPIGTPQYMSPEQARGVNVDTLTDVYSFGAMAYEMLTGRVPFEGVTVMDTLLKQISEEAQPPSTVCSDVSVELDAPILRMLSKDPAKRPRTLGAAVEELMMVAGDAGIPIASSSEVAIDPSVRAAVAQTIRVVTPPPETLIGATSEVRAAPRKRMGGVVAGVALATATATVVFFVMRSPTKATSTTPAVATPTASATASAIQMDARDAALVTTEAVDAAPTSHAGAGTSKSTAAVKTAKPISTDLEKAF